MYRNYRQLRDGWTKNLVLLFPRPGWLAAKTLLLWAISWIVMVFAFAQLRQWWWNPIFVAAFLYLTLRTRRANFDMAMSLLAASFGMPMFAYLLLRSKRAHATGNVSWKGRTYTGEDHPPTKITQPTPTTAGRLS